MRSVVLMASSLGCPEPRSTPEIKGSIDVPLWGDHGYSNPRAERAPADLGPPPAEVGDQIILEWECESSNARRRRVMVCLAVVIIHTTRESTAPMHASTTRMLTLLHVIALAPIAGRPPRVSYGPAILARSSA